MLVQVLGVGCSQCDALDAVVRKAIHDSGLDIRLERIGDIQRILSFDVLMTPALVIDGVVKCAGCVPSLDEVMALIRGSYGTAMQA